jgi:hypothetical protein
MACSVVKLCKAGRSEFNRQKVACVFKCVYRGESSFGFGISADEALEVMLAF